MSASARLKQLQSLGVKSELLLSMSLSLKILAFAFCLSFIGNIVLGFLYVNKAMPTMMTDDSGVPLGFIPINDNSLRNSDSIKASVKDFLQVYHSLNYATIWEDLESSLRVLEENFSKDRIHRLDAENLIAVIKENKYISRVEVDEISILKKGVGGAKWVVVAKGYNNVQSSGVVEKISFNSQLEFTVVGKSKTNPWGIAKVIVKEL